jgi:hypothetical protein
MQRRNFRAHAGAAVLLPARLLLAAAPEIPSKVAGISLPATPRAGAARAYARERRPPFLFNHCVRTDLSAPRHCARRGRGFVAEDASVASALHEERLAARHAA